jgi:hypothetical protein
MTAACKSFALCEREAALRPDGVSLIPNPCNPSILPLRTNEKLQVKYTQVCHMHHRLACITALHPAVCRLGMLGPPTCAPLWGALGAALALLRALSCMGTCEGSLALRSMPPSAFTVTFMAGTLDSTGRNCDMTWKPFALPVPSSGVGSPCMDLHTANEKSF